MSSSDSTLLSLLLKILCKFINVNSSLTSASKIVLQASLPPTYVCKCFPEAVLMLLEYLPFHYPQMRLNNNIKRRNFRQFERQLLEQSLLYKRTMFLS